MMWKFTRIFVPFWVLLPVFALSGAEITIPRLEVISRAASQNGEFAISSNASVDMALNGGYKYGVLLGLSFESANLIKALSYRNFAAGMADPAMFYVEADEYNELVDRYNNQAFFSFRVAKATARDLFNLPLELSYFVGLGDSFCSGEEFSSRYGVPNMETEFTGYYYFPEGIGGNPYRRYDGIHAVQGTGFSFALTKWEKFIPMLYLYQDIPRFNTAGTLSTKNFFSGDIRGLFNGEKFKAELFAGVSGGKGEKPDLRGGMLAFFSSGEGADFLIQCGVPGWVMNEKFSVDNWYFLMEPRIDFGLLALHVSFFYHPLQYLHIESEEERGKADINIKLFIGDLEEFRFQGGLETTVGIKVDKQKDFSLKISPFISLVSDGLCWDFKLRLNPLASATPEKMLEVFAGIRTAY
jgi:hypothetical protein